MVAKYALEVVQQAAREGRVDLDSSRAFDVLCQHFRTLLDCYPFAAAVLLELRADHWSKTVTLPDKPHAGVYDEYCIQISEALAAAHGITVRDWYLKLRLTESFSGETVFFVSFHPAERLRVIKGSVRK